MVMVEAPRVRVCHRLAQAAAETARQSTPLCSQKRLSSLITSAVRSAGETSASGTQRPRRTVASVRRRCSGSPARSSTWMSEGRQAARTSSKRSSAKAPAAACASSAAASARRRKVETGGGGTDNMARGMPGL